MTIEVEKRYKDIETSDANDFSNDGAVIRFVATTDESEDEPAVRDYVKSNTPDEYENLVRSVVDIKRESDDVWDIVVTYEPKTSEFAKPKLDVDETRWSIQSGANGTAKRTFSMELMEEVAAVPEYEFDGTAAELVMGLTNTASGLEVVGHNVPIGGVTVAVETVKDNAAITAGYIIKLAEYARNQVVNSVAWKIFPLGTMQLVDFSAKERAGDDPNTDISMNFGYSPTLTGIEIGNGLTIAKKEGHDILDVLYTRKTIQSLPLSVPVRAAVHRVFPRVNLETELGI